jgi:peptidoglycan-associated lipoprotein
VLGIESGGNFGPNQDMKKMIWFTLLLAGCGGCHRRHHYPEFTAATAPQQIQHATFSSDSTPPPANATPAADTTSVVPDTPTDIAIRHPPNLGGALQDVYFAYDRSELSEAALAALRQDAKVICATLNDFPDLKFIIEGHCDERGSAEYNLALGDRRAHRAEDVLREYGVPAAAVEIVSYGKESPQCVEATESCWQKNRRAHISVRH